MTTHFEFMHGRVQCHACDWQGTGRQCKVGEVFERGEVTEYHCPACGERIPGAVPWPEFTISPKKKP